jgi:hypothetical protein
MVNIRRGIKGEAFGIRSSIFCLLPMYDDKDYCALASQMAGHIQHVSFEIWVGPLRVDINT